MLIAMATFDTPENRRTSMTFATLESIFHRVNLNHHRLVISDNGSTCPETIALLKKLSYRKNCSVIYNGQNFGTAVAINRVIRLRAPGEVVCKIDNDVVIEQTNWPEQIEAVFLREPKIGICCLKRNDLGEEPDAKEEHARTKLVMLPHKPGENWIVVEQLFGPAMGTVMCFSSALLDRIGQLYQMQDEGNLYGWDDSDASHRAKLAGFGVVFLPHILIHHIDPGGTEYTTAKQVTAGHWIRRFEAVREEYTAGTRALFWEDK